MDSNLTIEKTPDMDSFVDIRVNIQDTTVLYTILPYQLINKLVDVIGMEEVNRIISQLTTKPKQTP